MRVCSYAAQASLIVFELCSVKMQQHSGGVLSSMCFALVLSQGFAVCIARDKETLTTTVDVEYIGQLKEAGRRWDSLQSCASELIDGNKEMSVPAPWLP